MKNRKRRTINLNPDTIERFCEKALGKTFAICIKCSHIEIDPDEWRCLELGYEEKKERTSTANVFKQNKKGDCKKFSLKKAVNYIHIKFAK